MNHCVPYFETDEDYSIPAASTGLMRPKKSAIGGDEDIMELLWQNGQVVVQSQNQRSGGKKPHNNGDVTEQTLSSREIRSVEEETTPHHLFMQEDEMASWLHYPMDDSSFDRYLYSDLMYPPPAPVSALIAAPSSLPPASMVTVAPRPPILPSRRVESEPPAKYQNFVNFARPRATIESGSSIANKAAKEFTVVDSNETPAANGLESRVFRVADVTAQVSGGDGARFGTLNDTVGAAGTSTAAREMDSCELTETSSPGSGGSASASAGKSPQLPLATAAVDRKRKGRETDATTDCHNEDIGLECTDGKKQELGSTSAKRSRAAEVHNLSERRRRDRINEKMKALQELIPRCNKSNKASMLDEAIEYLKSLQMQVQMMSMGCSMVPMMFPGVQQYIPPMAMGMGMGMNSGMVPYPAVLPSPAMPPSAAAAGHMAPRFPVPAFQMTPVQVTDPSRIRAANSADPMMNSFVPQNPNQVRMPPFTDPYRQYLSLQQTHPPQPQTQALMQPCTSKPSSSKDIGNP